MRRRTSPLEWGLLALITLGAAILRLDKVGAVPPDPFYDAAVRSMSLSWHNFFFGAFEPGGSVSIDKPPVDLWLQVISVKALGFSTTTLKLPEAFAGILAVPLLFEAVRRLSGAAAGLCAAAAIAVVPVEVITSRSDTMDGVMMMLIVAALLFIVRAAETGRTRWLLAGAFALGVAFDVKLLESLVALPGLAVLAYLGLPGARRRRLAQLALAGVLYVVIALAWLTATLIAPASDRPYAIGSTNGSAWNAAFIFNGKDRLSGKSPEPSGTVYEPGHVYPTATQSERDHIPILPPSALRLLERVGPLSGQRLGMEILVALLLGLPALLLGLRVGEEEAVAEAGGGDAESRPAPGETPAAPAAEDAAGGAPAADPGLPLQRRLARAAAGGLILWMATGLVLFSHMARLHPRYVEGFVPVVAAMLGIGVAWAVAPRGRVRLGALLIVLVVVVYYAERLLFGRPATWWLVLLGALGAAVTAVLANLRAGRPESPRLSYAAMALTLLAILAVGVKADATAITNKVSDAGFVGQLPGAEQAPLSAYLIAHQGSAYYETAAESATSIGSLIVKDARPIDVLTTYNGRVYTGIDKLRHQIAEGKVKYAFLNTFCSSHSTPINAACAAPVKWIRANGRDVSRAAGLPTGGTLYLLPGAKP
jgi:4-amino-4-deoxy-L-arabinose transferase-like glycosyltransferase